MSYERINFKKGQVLEAEHLNHMEEGIANGGVSLVTTTYADLVALRDAGNLAEGALYRITDYETTTNLKNTISAGHPFDIVVLALDKSTLSERAYAMHSERDTDGYFANSNLAAWEIWYSLDNDRSRFAWADADETTSDINTPGEHTFESPIVGVEFQLTRRILRPGARALLSTSPAVVHATLKNANTLIVESSDTSTGGTPIKVVLSKENGVGKGVIYRMIDEFNNDVPYDFKNIMFEEKEGFIIKKSLNIYTFNRDQSLDKVIDGINYYGYSSDKVPPQWSANTCWVTDSEVTTETSLYNEEGTIENWPIWRVLTDRSYYTFAEADDLIGASYDNTIKYCHTYRQRTLNFISFGGNTIENIFEENCSNIILGGNSSSNTFGNSCTYNTFGNSCSNNTFGTGCSYNTFGSNCTYNTFGINCSNNTFGTGCHDNTFGNGCSNNTFGTGCTYNTLGNSCTYNTFGDSCSTLDFSELDYVRYCLIDAGCQDIVLTNDEDASRGNQCQHYHFTSGVTDATVAVKRGLLYETTVAKDTSGSIKQYCAADIIYIG